MPSTTDYTGVDVLEIMAGADNYNRYLASLVEKEIRDDFVVMDFGAGTGTFALPLQERGIHVICIEPDPYLKNRLQQSGLTVFSDVSEIHNNSIDLIYTFNVFEHIKNDAEVIKELSKKLKKGGRMVAYVPAFPVLFSSFDKKVGHYRRYRLNGLSNKISSAGLHIIKASYADSLGFLAALLYKSLNKENGEVNPALVTTFDRYIFPISRILDIFLNKFIGKNLYILSEKL